MQHYFNVTRCNTENDLNFSRNGRRTKFCQMEDDLNSFQIEDDLNIFQIKDVLNIYVNNNLVYIQGGGWDKCYLQDWLRN